MLCAVVVIHAASLKPQDAGMANILDKTLAKRFMYNFFNALNIFLMSTGKKLVHRFLFF